MSEIIMQYFTLLIGLRILQIATFASYFSINRSAYEVFQEVNPFLTSWKMPRGLYQHQPALSLYEIQTTNTKKKNSHRFFSCSLQCLFWSCSFVGSFLVFLAGSMVVCSGCCLCPSIDSCNTSARRPTLLENKLDNTTKLHILRPDGL
jgi:hypothetical protein